ncbi:MAG: class I SAM-dependent methyltransferase [Candidatus Omnitrophica bacterium]|nr:class I SAM-dependent methyltransferase [Candidatus Omnitrophota bacterium]
MQEKASVVGMDKFCKNSFDAFFQKIPFLWLKKLLDRNNIDLNEKSVLIAGCGIGRDIYHLQDFYKFDRLYASDISIDSLKSTISSFPLAKGVIVDNQRLGLETDSVDYVFVGTSLHHLKEPLRGLYELLRVAKKGLIVMEPNDTWLTRLFEKLGLAQEYEIEHKNYVYRFRKREVAKISNALFFKYDLCRFFATHRAPTTKIEFCALKIIHRLSNLFFPSFGNHIVFIIKKEKLLPRCLQAK